MSSPSIRIDRMGTNSTNSATPGPSRTAIYTSLFDALCRHRNAERAARMADALLRRDATGDQLVALVDDCQRAVFYNPNGRTLKGYAFDHHGLREADVDALWRPLSDAASWVDAHEEACDWVHPHFRWVLDGEMDADAWGLRVESDR